MTVYHKIQSIFKRDMSVKGHPMIVDDWTSPEFKYLACADWMFTEKVDGMNIRVIFEPGKAYRVLGRTDNADIPKQLLHWIDNHFNPQAEKIHAAFPNGIVFYGEGYGPKIQKGHVYGDEQRFVLFDIKIQTWWLERITIETIAKDFNIPIVPIVGYGTLFDMIAYVKQRPISSWGNFISEGVVAKPTCELQDKKGNRIITKLKVKDVTCL